MTKEQARKNVNEQHRNMINKLNTAVARLSLFACAHEAAAAANETDEVPVTDRQLGELATVLASVREATLNDLPRQAQAVMDHAGIDCVRIPEAN
tara:strand:+ start:515 stop:799 length:285 start_codon:yes stop_codon:yes gene_type:complete